MDGFLATVQGSRSRYRHNVAVFPYNIDSINEHYDFSLFFNYIELFYIPPALLKF